MDPTTSKPLLRRELGLIDSVSIGLGAIIGAGIFVLVGIAAGMAGPSVVLSVILSALSASFTALSFSELGAALPRAGGVYEYGHTLLHPLAGFVMGWMWVFGNIVLGATGSLGFGYYLSLFAPWLDYRASAMLLILTVVALNIAGSKLSASLNNAIVAGKVLTLVLFSIVGLPRIKVDNFSPFLPKGPAAVVSAAALFYFAYIGFPRVSTMAEEVKEPERTIPMAILIALGTSTLIYLLVTVTAVGVAGWERLSRSTAPLGEVAKDLGIGWIVGVGGLLATFSVVLTSAMGQSRVFFAMARNREIPEILSKLHPKLGTPIYSILFSGCVMTTLALTVDVSGLATLTSFLVLASHVLTNLADIRLYAERIEAPFKAPFRPLHALIGLTTSAVLMLSTGAWAVTAGSLVVLFGVVWYTLYTKLRPQAHGMLVFPRS